MDVAVGASAASSAAEWESLLDGLRREYAWSVERTVERMRTLPSYADLDTAALRAVVARNHEAILTGLMRGRRPRPSDATEIFADTGATRARQGVATSDMLAAWRIGQESLYLLASTLVGEGPRRDQQLREFLEMEISWVDFAMLAAADGHRQAELALAREREHAQANLLRRMLAGAIAPAELRMALLPLGLDPDAAYRAVRSCPTPSHGIHDIERELGLDVPPAAAQGLVALIDGDLCGFVRDLPKASVSTPVGVSAPTPLPEFKSAFRLATRAFDTARALGAVGVFDLEMLGIQAAIASDADVGDVLRRRYVDGFTGVTGGDVILNSVERFLENDLSVDATARELGVHSNTVRQRLSRFEAKTGRSLREAETIAEVWWALQRRRLET